MSFLSGKFLGKWFNVANEGYCFLYRLTWWIVWFKLISKNIFRLLFKKKGRLAYPYLKWVKDFEWDFKYSIFTRLAALFCRLTTNKAKFPSLTATARVQKYDFRRISARILSGFILLFKPQLKKFAAKDAMSNFSIRPRRLAVKNINKFDFKCFLAQSCCGFILSFNRN